MKEHYSKRTMEVHAYCKKCKKRTFHRVDDGRKGPCLTCIEKLEEHHKLHPMAEQPKQERLFG